jgi:phosphoglycolate phosphatase
MPRQFDLIVFDWDGTLVDSSQIIVDSIQSASLDAGLPMPTDAAVRGIIGLSLRPAIARLFAEVNVTEEQLHTMAQRYAHHFHLRDHSIRLFDGVTEAMQELEAAGFRLAVATGKGRRGLEHALDSSGLRGHFLASRCADECHSKPHPQMLIELMEELGAQSERALMVGDTSHDLQMARNAGVASLAVTYGAQSLQDLLPLGPLAHFDRFTNVHRWLIMNG